MKHLSESNKKILTQSINSQKDKIPAHVITIMQKSKYPQYHLDEKFKNMQDPLSYNNSKKVQQLKKDAFSASKSLHQEMDQVSQVSKYSYKQVMTPQGNRYDFDQLLIRRFNNDSSLSDKQFYQKLKAKSEKFKKQQYDPQDYMQRLRLLNYPLKDLSNLLAKENQYFNQKQFNELNETSKSFVQKPLTYDVIKQMNSMGLGQNFKDYEFYDLLKRQPVENNEPYVSQFNLSTNKKINRPAIDLKLNLIQKSLQFSSLSRELFFDFDGDLNFWRMDTNKEWMDEKNKKISDEDIMRQFMDMDMGNIGVNYMIKFANKKITPWGISQYKKLRKIHKKTQRQIEKSAQGSAQSLTQEYYKLLQEYRFLRHSRKAQRQATPIKLVNSQAQTIYTMPDQEFDNYFKDDTLQILSQINKLNNLRQRVIKQNGYKNKIVMIQNICQNIKQLLFGLLLMMLKDEKFLSSEGFLFFSYRDLMEAENKSEAQNMLLKFILKNIDKFQVQQVDNVPKSDIIKIYAQQKDNNNKILQIIRGK